MTLRAASWLRVSSRQQSESEREGLPAQQESVSRGIATLNAQDTGLSWTLAHSGKNVHETREWTDMLSQAGKTFDAAMAQERLDVITFYERHALDEQGRTGASTLSRDRLRTLLMDFSALLRAARGSRHEDEVFTNIVNKYFASFTHLGSTSLGFTPTLAGVKAITAATLPSVVNVGDVGGEGLPVPSAVWTIYHQDSFAGTNEDRLAWSTRAGQKESLVHFRE